MSERVCKDCGQPCTEAPGHDCFYDDACCYRIRGGEDPCGCRDALRVALERVTAENDRLRQDRSDALNVKTREGLTCSEWIARTGKAERQRDEAVEALAPMALLSAEYDESYDKYDTFAVAVQTGSSRGPVGIRISDLRRAASIVAKGKG